MQCYLPIIGQDSLSLYLYTLAFWDDGQKEHLFAAILNHLNFGMDRLLKAFKILSAFNLVTLYQKGDGYELAIHPTLSSSDFLRHKNGPGLKPINWPNQQLFRKLFLSSACVKN